MLFQANLSDDTQKTKPTAAAAAAAAASTVL